MIPLLLALTLAFSFPAPQSKSISRVCFTRGDYIFVKDMKTGIEKRLVKGSYPALSPDGATLAFSVDNLESSSSEMSRQVKLMDLGTGKITDLPALRRYLCYGGVWSPDGSKLALNMMIDKQWEVGVIDEDHKLQVPTKSISKNLGVYLSGWTLDSKTITCHDLDKIYQIDLNGSVVKTIVTSEVVDDISFISSATTFLLSSDGRYLLFDTETQPGEARIPMLWAYDLHLKKRTRISPARLQSSGPQWLGSDNEIVFYGKAPTRGARPGAYRMKTDGTQIDLVLANVDQFSVAVGR